MEAMAAFASYRVEGFTGSDRFVAGESSDNAIMLRFSGG
jgi:hypothetical protein